MDKKQFSEALTGIFYQCPGNRVVAAELDQTELCIFQEPLIGFAKADDPIFETYGKEGVIGPGFMGPLQWLPEARTVVSFFFPFTEQVRRGRQITEKLPSYEWLYGRIEGQEFLAGYIRRVLSWMKEQGISACAPSGDERFELVKEPVKREGTDDYAIRSSWSERHAAYACGLGTFGLSKGLITKAGVAGRFASIIMDLPLEPDQREYTGIYEYCTLCGACVNRCPCGAISLERGKNHYQCNRFMEQTAPQFAPRYGCGLCQTRVPCEHQKPVNAVKH